MSDSAPSQARWVAILFLVAALLLAIGMALGWLITGDNVLGAWALIVTVLTTLFAGALWWGW